MSYVVARRHNILRIPRTRCHHGFGHLRYWSAFGFLILGGSQHGFLSFAWDLDIGFFGLPVGCGPIGRGLVGDGVGHGWNSTLRTPLGFDGRDESKPETARVSCFRHTNLDPDRTRLDRPIRFV